MAKKIMARCPRLLQGSERLNCLTHPAHHGVSVRYGTSWAAESNRLPFPRVGFQGCWPLTIRGPDSSQSQTARDATPVPCKTARPHLPHWPHAHVSPGSPSPPPGPCRNALARFVIGDCACPSCRSCALQPRRPALPRPRLPQATARPPGLLFRRRGPPPTSRQSQTNTDLEVDRRGRPKRPFEASQWPSRLRLLRPMPFLTPPPAGRQP